MFNIFHTDEAREQLNKIKIDRGLSKRYKAVKKAIEFLSLNPRHPGLQTHEFTTQRKSDHHYRNHSSSIDRINPTKNPFALLAVQKSLSLMEMGMQLKKQGLLDG